MNMTAARAPKMRKDGILRKMLPSGYGTITS
jgi:hypothetical protein